MRYDFLFTVANQYLDEMKSHMIDHAHGVCQAPNALDKDSYALWSMCYLIGVDVDAVLKAAKCIERHNMRNLKRGGERWLMISDLSSEQMDHLVELIKEEEW